MQHSKAVIELDALLTNSDPDSMDWGEYAHEDGEKLLSRLSAEDRAELFRSAKTKPTDWRACLVNFLHPSDAEQSEALIGALWDVDDNIVGEAMSRRYFFCGFCGSARKGVFEDARIRVPPFWDRVRWDRRVLERLERLSQGNAWAAYWNALSTATRAGRESP